MTRFTVLAMVTCLNSFTAHGQQPVNFASEVYPILARSCLECHGERKQAGGMRLDNRSELLASGSVEPGMPEASELVRRISLPKLHEEVMPEIGEPLTTAEIATISRWIKSGALWPEDFSPQQHWAYLPPRRPSLPQVSHVDWASSPIDRFVLEQMEAVDVQPAPPAEPEKLVRRLYLDLIGIPPTPEEVSAFLAAPPTTRYENLVDHLLGRAEFGERWARPWLDLARYADSHGFQRDDLRDIWAYRDWVIRALNDDMPFDQFSIEQIAGDLLPNATESQRIATGFHRCTPTNVEAGSLPEETRIEQVFDRVNTTGAVWLGTTLECCQCHDHKYDPFSMADYYRLLAFYNNTEMEADRKDAKSASSIAFLGPSMPLSNQRQDEQREALETKVAMVKGQLEARRQLLDADLIAWAQELHGEAQQGPQMHTLAIENFQSQGTTDSYKILDDGSVLLVGSDPPERDTYRFTASPPVDAQAKVKESTRAYALENIRALRLDALQHDSLPGKGPGRGETKRTNFVLHEFVVKIKHGESAARPLELVSAQASFSQSNWSVAGALSNQAKTGWAIAPKFNQPHWATFALAEPLNLREGERFEFELVQDFGSARTLGRFRVSAVTGNLDVESIPADVVKLLAQATDSMTTNERKKLLNYRVERDATSAQLQAELKQLQNQIEEIQPDTTLVMIELDQPRTSYMFERGDYRQPTTQIEPGVPAALHALPEVSQAERLDRLALAQWLVSRENPLVARVTVNRWWAELFGTGIVATPEDFGVKGELPSHPSLLDWLAVELMIMLGR
ncbi:MAG: DUF1549 domain-containing protein [Pirellulaceae bacterium]